MTGAITAFVMPIVGQLDPAALEALLILGVGLAWLGYALWAGAGEPPSRLTITAKPSVIS